MPSKNDNRTSSESNHDDINTKLDRILCNQDDMIKTLSQNQLRIQKLEEENVELRGTVNVLEENLTRLHKYSRKGVMIVTGYTKLLNEDPVMLRSNVVGMLNKVLTPEKHLNLRDFVDIHRNSKVGKNGKPPTITVKFIRYTDKNLFFNRESIKDRRTRLPGINFFHNMCKALIEEQGKISKHSHVKFVRYEGDNRHFSVCMVYDNNISFLNYIQNYKHFCSKYKEWYETVDC